jgi:hypothetical protein
MSTEWVSYALEIVILLFIVAYLLHRYISLKIVPLYAYVVVFFGYFLSISILFLMPVDVAMVSFFFPLISELFWLNLIDVSYSERVFDV